MAARIKPRRIRRLFIAQWREARGLTQEGLGEKLGVAGNTVARWERSEAQLNTQVMAAVAEALDLEPQDLFRSPDTPSADALLRGQERDILDQAMKLIQAIRR